MALFTVVQAGKEEGSLHSLVPSLGKKESDSFVSMFILEILCSPQEMGRSHKGKRVHHGEGDSFLTQARRNELKLIQPEAVVIIMQLSLHLT